MKKSLELCEMFLKGRSETNLSKKQIDWLADTLKKEKIAYAARWDGKESFIIIDNDKQYNIVKYAGIGKITVTTYVKPNETWMVYKDIVHANSVKAPAEGQEIEEIKWYMSIGIKYIMIGEEQPTEIEKVLSHFETKANQK